MNLKIYYLFSTFFYLLLGLIISIVFGWIAYNFLGFIASNFVLTLFAYGFGLICLSFVPTIVDDSDAEITTTMVFISIIAVILFYVIFMFIMPKIFGSAVVVHGPLDTRFGFKLDLSHIYIYVTIIVYIAHYKDYIIQLINSLLFFLLE